MAVRIYRTVAEQRPMAVIYTCTPSAVASDTHAAEKQKSKN